ncbi:sigma-70 family RNA polymerase sigma factor [Nakamurella leprariae]|uniref:Sigma-70 family RNA polymerase sigma factor n=1 Tax=Nakamurella leprariae TaxID=2803911 RepID=A0A938YHQ7_9ACTN|nr:sigma-70 family RNA polymerase sigma factor [Nakamurella leprariae]MBM9468020.1 sigma-70 family RNA polymerase sigma factor [Nakamurella leprariae]
MTSTVSTTTGTDRAAEPRTGALDPELEQHRRELTGYCYRMLGSAFDAEDAVQETMVRAWRAQDRFEGRASTRTWLYSIATNVCLDSLNSRGRRARPMDLSSDPWQPVAGSLAASRGHESWVEPIGEAGVLADTQDPADLAVQRESIKLAFVAALQYLPARQRAVLILRDVLRWPAAEVADLLETTTASVNSALQRAHATLAGRPASIGEVFDPLNAEQRELLDAYVDAFQRYDMDALVALLHQDVTQNMPPYELWLEGPADVAAWMVGPGAACRDSVLLPVRASGQPAFAQYKPAADGTRRPWAVHVLEIRDGRIGALTTFLDTRLFAAMGAPDFLPAA